ncbi:MAG: IS30 family transposase [Alphaproteobacteria bacterium]|nr:IS30 family transposase [Alphaproteobacteria bacterium]
MDKLQCHFWTPEQIAGYLRHRQKKLRAISHETIYSWIYAKAQKQEKLWKFLPRHKAKRGLRKSIKAGLSSIPNRISIHDRPKIIEQKKDFGHWEGDLMSFMKNSQHMLVLRERKTMFTLSTPLQNKKALDTARAIISLLKGLPKKSRKSVTYDNGGEFAAHSNVFEAIAVPAFFCDPYASWQKGGVENTNGRLRRDLPRKTNLKIMRSEDFNETIDNYNLTPRKNLGWLSPLEAFHKNLNRVALST